MVLCGIFSCFVYHWCNNRNYYNIDIKKDAPDIALRWEMSQSNFKQEKRRSKFKVFVCYSKETQEKAHILESVLGEKGFGTYMVDGKSCGNFISPELRDMLRLSVYFVLVSASNFIDSSLINQEIGYAQGKGLRIMLLIRSGLKDTLGINTKLNVIEFDEDNFRQQCTVVANKVIETVKILDEPIDLDAFLDFYTKTNS